MAGAKSGVGRKATELGKVAEGAGASGALLGGRTRAVKLRGKLGWALVLALAGVLDGLATVGIVQMGGAEANPIMGLLVEKGTPAFLVGKTGVDVVGAAVLCYCWDRSWLARRALPVLALLQTGVAFYATAFLLRLVISGCLSLRG